jgi:hypothetical protein
MMNALHRRDFLKAAGIGVAGPWISDLEAGGHAENKQSVLRPRLFTGCYAYSYGKYLKTGQMVMEDFILKALELDLDGMDLTTYWLKSTDPAYVVSLHHFAFKQGVPISGIGIRSVLCQPDPGWEWRSYSGRGGTTW